MRYANRALHILQAKRHTGTKARLVSETAAGEILLVARSSAGKEQVLEWYPLVSPPVPL